MAAGAAAAVALAAASAVITTNPAAPGLHQAGQQIYKLSAQQQSLSCTPQHHKECLALTPPASTTASQDAARAKPLVGDVTKGASRQIMCVFIYIPLTADLMQSSEKAQST